MIGLLLLALVGQDVTIDAKDLPVEHVLDVPGPGSVQVTVVEGPQGFALRTDFPEGVPSNPTHGQARVAGGPVKIRISDAYGIKREGRLTLRVQHFPWVDPSEPNDDVGHVRSVQAGSVELAIFPRDDVDMLEIEAPHSGYILISAPEPPQGLNLLAEVISESGAALGANIVRLDLPGRYRIRVRDAYYFSSPHAFRVDIAFQPANDVLEPNDTDEMATRVDLGAWYPGVVWPPKDVDIFEIQVEEHGTVVPRVQNATTDLGWTLRDSRGRPVNGPPFAVEPGRYYVAVTSRWGQSNGEVFEFQIAFAPALDELEPNDKAPVEIEVGRLYRVSLAGADDEDRFRVRVPGPGMLAMRIFGEGPDRLRFTVDGVTGREVIKRVEGPVEVRMWMDGARSPKAFYISAEWRPHEPGEPNDSRESAAPIAFGAATDLTLWPEGDQDWFRVEAPGPGHLVALLHEGLLAHILASYVVDIEVFDAAGTSLGRLGQDPRRRETYRRTLRIESAGTLYLKVAFASGVSEDPMALTAYFLADGAVAPATGAGGVVFYVLGLEPDERLTPELRMLAHTAHGAFLSADKVEEIAPKLEEAVKRATEAVEKQREEAAKAKGGVPWWVIVIPVAAAAGILAMLLRRSR